MIKISDYFAGFQRNRDGFAWSYLFITLIIWILGAVFYRGEGDREKERERDSRVSSI